MALGLAWLLTLAATQVRVVDSAREVAGRPPVTTAGPPLSRSGGGSLPAGPRSACVEQGDTVVVRVRSRVPGPGGLLAFLPPVEVDAEAVAAREER